MPRSSLYERIDQRVDLMMKEGLLDEVRSLARDPRIWQCAGFKGSATKSGVRILRKKQM